MFSKEKQNISELSICRIPVSPIANRFIIVSYTPLVYVISIFKKNSCRYYWHTCFQHSSEHPYAPCSKALRRAQPSVVEYLLLIFSKFPLKCLRYKYFRIATWANGCHQYSILFHSISHQFAWKFWMGRHLNMRV